jgi:hypothetical protein
VGDLDGRGNSPKTYMKIFSRIFNSPPIVTGSYLYKNSRIDRLLPKEARRRAPEEAPLGVRHRDDPNINNCIRLADRQGQKRV